MWSPLNHIMNTTTNETDAPVVAAEKATAQAKQLIAKSAQFRHSLKQARPNSSNESSTVGVAKAVSALLDRLPHPRSF